MMNTCRLVAILVASFVLLGCAGTSSGAASTRPNSAVARPAIDPSSFETKIHEDAKVEVDVPRSWKVEMEGDQLVIASPDGTAALVFIIVDSKSRDTAVHALDKELSSQIKNVRKGPSKACSINRLKAARVEGTATNEGRPVEFTTVFVETPGGKVLLVLGMSETAHAAKHRPTLDHVLGSLRPR